jgi:hypothetical protein
VSDDTCYDCGKSIVCFVCESCESCCVNLDPDECWQIHEVWRLTGVDRALGVSGRIPLGVPAVPKPRRPTPGKPGAS